MRRRAAHLARVKRDPVALRFAAVLIRKRLLLGVPSVLALRAAPIIKDMRVSVRAHRHLSKSALTASSLICFDKAEDVAARRANRDITT